MVDLSVLEVLGDSKLDRKRDFIVTENYHVRLRPAAAEALIDRFSANMNRRVRFRNRPLSYETVVLEMARSLARHLIEPGRSLDLSFPFSMGESGHVTSDVRERILALTPAERKAMGIAKNTWHYIKHRAQTGKPLRLYSKVRDRVED
jgi:CRISPR-associated protein Cas1